ncbi:MAG TPA: VWA domain-containing protein [Pyrinomonadaceae bacterium]|nr:VWA domain-containing protein [Pyrinomonadaceae bacterium]
MRTFRCLLFICLGVPALTVASLSQTQTAPGQQGEQKVVVNAAEVPFDVVVRDRKGRPVTDLRASDFEVYEDGVAQQVNSFRLVTREQRGGSDATAGATPESPDSLKNQRPVTGKPLPGVTEAGPRLSAVAIVFDRLTPDGRARASRAALSYLGEKDDLVGVFLTDLSLITLQSYTNDTQLVRKAIENAGTSSLSLYISTNAQARDVRKLLGEAIEEVKRNPQNSGAQMAKKLLEMQLWDLEINEESQRNQQGLATIHGLLQVASSLQALPGRKAIILFSEGLVIPPLVAGPFRELINAANRNNVSIYTIDAAGLRVESKLEETRKEIVSRSNLRMIQEANKEDSRGPMTKGLERNEDLLNLNPDSGLGQLADQTGGFYITDTNGIETRLQKIDEDLHTYYMMSYSPKNQSYDGGYRKIEVRVKRPGLSVQSRKGYFAINGVFATPVLSYEAPALALLGKGERPQSFPLRAAAFNFPEAERTGLAPVIVEAPMGAITFQADNSGKLYKTDFSIVVLVKDQAGQVVQKLSKQYQLSGALTEMEAAKQGRLLFYREADLPPGRYNLETIAYDQPTGRASARTGVLEVPETDAGKLRLSSVVIVMNVEKTTADAKTGSPFQVGDLILYPNVEEAIHKATSKQLPFFFTIYTPAGAQTAPKLLIELRQNGKALARIPAEINAPDAKGRIQYVAGLPLESIPPGQYELKVIVEDGVTTLTRSGFFSVEK